MDQTLSARFGATHKAAYLACTVPRLGSHETLNFKSGRFGFPGHVSFSTEICRQVLAFRASSVIAPRQHVVDNFRLGHGRPIRIV